MEAQNRECKNCKTNKHIDNFEKTNKTKNIYRRICKKCRTIKRKEYMKNYWKKNFISNKKPKDENVIQNPVE